MAKYASKVVDQAKAWIGRNEADGSHKHIIDVYNSHKPLARGYKVKYTDAWCATFVSAVAVKLGYTDIIPTECSCTKMIELLKNLGVWQENEAVTPLPGWILFYDWEDNGNGDNRGNADHVGIVEMVVGDTITVIEGNYSNSVKRRNIRVNGKNIRGYGVPKYDTETTKTTTTKGDYTMEMRNLKKGCTGEDVRALQILLNGRGYNCGNVDGDFGSKTDAAVRKYQKAKGLTQDGIAGKKTVGSLLGAS
jgi:hypothetical protein